MTRRGRFVVYLFAGALSLWAALSKGQQQQQNGGGRQHTQLAPQEQPHGPFASFEQVHFPAGQPYEHFVSEGDEI